MQKMRRDERVKAMRTAAAECAANPLVPASIRVGVAALVEESIDQRERLDKLEREIFGDLWPELPGKGGDHVAR